MKTQTILIPTDFSDVSFNCLPALVEQFGGTPLSLVFTHPFKLSDSISDLLMLSRRNREHAYISDSFYKQCRNLQTSFPEITSIKIEFFYGSTLSTFKNFLQCQDITYILDPQSCSCTKLNPHSLDAAALISKVSTPILQLSRRGFNTNKISVPDNDRVLQNY